MDYFKAFETLKTALEKAKIPVGEGHFAIQVRISDEDCAGIFYIEAKDKQLYVEPYDYYDHDVDILTSVKDFKSIIEGKLDIKKAIEGGKIVVNGYTEGLIAFLEALPKKAPAKKASTKKATAKEPVAKKAATKKPATKAAKKKTEAVKVKEDTKKPETKETIAEVVEKEVKPEKKTKK